MLLKPHRQDVASIAFYLGRILWIVAATGLIPVAVAVVEREWQPLGWFVTMVGVAALLAASTERFRPRNHSLRWGDGMVVVALTWLVVPIVGAIPFVLSGHFGDVIDALFESMSGFTATGLSVMSDIDHNPTSLTVWRQTTQFLGGQGIVLAALSVFAGEGILALYHGEARDERVFPSVRSTARFIWIVSLWHGVLGVTGYFIVGVTQLGYEPGRALLHGYSIFIATFDTGGFAPMSTSLAYYRSVQYELITMWLMVAGTLSFGVHHALWRGPRRILRNLESKTLLASVIITSTVAFAGLIAAGTFTNVGTVVRRGFFHVLSAHTSTGFATVTSTDMLAWSGLTIAALTTAMALGGMASSTSGGVKALRVGLTIRALTDTIREVLLPEHSVMRRTYFQNGQRQLTAKLGQSVMAVSLLFVALYLAGAVAGVAYGFGLFESLFESVSAGGTVGLTAGITSPTMPIGLELIYMLLMWAGRLEFIAIFALIGFAWASVVGE